MSAAGLSSSIHLREPGPSHRSSRTYVIYYITGNPGLIEYYRIFLTHLYGLLQQTYNASSSSPPINFHIFGRSLSGFEMSVEPEKDLENDKSPPYDVAQQIELSVRSIKDIVRQVKDGDTEKDVRVILMGHSLGTYMCLEIMRRLREEVPLQRNDEQVRVVGGVLLFATVMHLAKSPSGLKSAALLSLPRFPWIVSLFAKLLTFPIPTPFLTTLIRLFMNFPYDAARVTAAFLKSPHGVHQALYLANDEMTEISADKWDEEIWGAAHDSSHQHPRPVLRFLFGKTDHWVADEVRDELIKARGVSAEGRDEEDWKPKMDVDEVEGWPHGFCIKHSVPVAERVRGYVEDIVSRDLAS